MRKLLSLMAGIILACTVFTTSAAEASRYYGGVYLGTPSIYIGPGYGYGYYPYRAYRGNYYYGNRYYYPHRYHSNRYYNRPYRHYRHHRNW